MTCPFITGITAFLTDASHTLQSKHFSLHCWPHKQNLIEILTPFLDRSHPKKHFIHATACSGTQAFDLALFSLLSNTSSALYPRFFFFFFNVAFYLRMSHHISSYHFSIFCSHAHRPVFMCLPSSRTAPPAVMSKPLVWGPTQPRSCQDAATTSDMYIPTMYTSPYAAKQTAHT